MPSCLRPKLAPKGCSFATSWFLTATYPHRFRSFVLGPSQLLTCLMIQYHLSLFLSSLSYHCILPPSSGCDISALRGAPHPPNPTRQSTGESTPSLHPWAVPRRSCPHTPNPSCCPQAGGFSTFFFFCKVLSQNNQLQPSQQLHWAVRISEWHIYGSITWPVRMACICFMQKKHFTFQKAGLALQ